MLRCSEPDRLVADPKNANQYLFAGDEPPFALIALRAHRSSSFNMLLLRWIGHALGAKQAASAQDMFSPNAP